MAMRSSRVAFMRLGVLAAVCAAAQPNALAQNVQSEQLPAVKEVPAGKSQKSAGAAPATPGAESSGLRQRVEQLEEQLVDLQVVIGTLESLARTGVAAPSAPVRSEANGSLSSSDQSRLDGLETQVRALTAQVEQLANEVRAQGAAAPQRRSDAAGYAPAGGASPGYPDVAPSGAPQTSRFGSTTVTSDNADPGGAPTAAQAGTAPPVNAPPPSYGSEQLPPAGGGDQYAAIGPPPGASAKQVYETAYGYLLQQDYASAQAGFRDFLKSYPQDPLAPNALYWLGESHYVQKNYADAAEAFDLVVQAYGTSSKAADAQLKRGMSLAQLGKKADACTSLRGLAQKFPSAPANLKAKADSERQRIGCP
jgi:tol-pal system protein YbgF